MTRNAALKPLVDHLCASSPLQAEEAEKLVAEVVAFFSETPDEFVRRRHREMRAEGRASNEQIFSRIEAELSRQVFAAPRLSRRQIRRIVYG